MNSKAELTIGVIPANNIAASEEDSEEQRNFRHTCTGISKEKTTLRR